MGSSADIRRDERDSGSASATTQEAAFDILLVARSPEWEAAVRAVADQVAGSRVWACGPSEALVELARGDSFSHLLIEVGCADGLLDALAGLTASHALNCTSLLMLGVHSSYRAGGGVIASADHRRVREALLASRKNLNAGPNAAATAAGSISTAELREAIRGDMMEAQYQPIVRLADRTPVAFEALARLHHKTRGTLLPDHFVPQLEAAGFARELTQSISARVFSDLGRGLFATSDVSVAVNFPLNVLTERAALLVMDEQRAAAGIPASRVVLELTESQPVDNLTELTRSLEWLRALGYGVSIDDVGPAVPRARELIDLPFSGLKLDKGIVQSSETSAEAMTFLKSTVTSAKQRGLTVVAEGIRTPELWDLMRSLDVDYAQGFLVARPLPTAALMIWLQAWQETGGRVSDTGR